MMDAYKIETANKRIRSVTNLGVITNIALFILKTTVGFVAGSMALIADGIHSLSDLVTDLAVLIGVQFGSRKPDRSHPYGHGRVETFSAVFIALALALVGSTMIYHAAADIAEGKVAMPGNVVLVVALISITAKELLYKITRKTAIQSHSPALYANAWHHRSDALSSVAVLIGFVSLKFGFIYGDQIAAIAVGIMVVLVGVRVLGQCLSEFSEHAVDAKLIEQITQIIASESRIHHWHNLRTRMMGREVFLDLHILVSPELSITAAHEIAENLENTLHNQVARPVNITVHVEPDRPDLRK